MPSPSPASQPNVEPPPPSERAAEEATPSAPEPPSPPAAIDLSPRATAMAAMPGSPDRAATATAAAAQPSDRSATLSADLRAAASAQADALRSPRKLELRRDPDGTCHYEGSAFNATIHPDGGVEFADRELRVERIGGVAEPPEKPFTVEDTSAEVRVEGRLKFTPRAWDAERAWFMRETQSLRDELSDAAYARELEQKELGLRRELDRIWCDESRPKPLRRRAIFELWADISGDEVGARGRRVILEYVRRNLPNGSADAYSEGELSALNLGRAERDLFEPYAAAVP